MDGHRFDDLTRQLAAATPRRRVLRALAGGLGAALGVASGREAAAAKPPPCTKGKPCTAPSHCCPGERCVDGSCRASCAGKDKGCPGGFTCCRGSCVSTACAASGQTLDPTTCRCECPADRSACNGGCVDPLTDRANCGSCGQACGPGEACINGACAGACPAGEFGCCTCNYRELATGNYVSTCTITDTCANPCGAGCEANTPVGTEFAGSAVGCSADMPPGQTYTCISLTSPGFAGLACGALTCQPAGT